MRICGLALPVALDPLRRKRLVERRSCLRRQHTQAEATKTPVSGTPWGWPRTSVPTLVGEAFGASRATRGAIQRGAGDADMLGQARSALPTLFSKSGW